MFVSWSINCTLCKEAEIIDRVFIYSWDAIFFGHVLNPTSKKCSTLQVILYTSFLYKPPNCPYDMLCLCFEWWELTITAYRHRFSGRETAKVDLFRYLDGPSCPTRPKVVFQNPQKTFPTCLCDAGRKYMSKPKTDRLLKYAPIFTACTSEAFLHTRILDFVRDSQIEHILDVPIVRRFSDSISQREKQGDIPWRYNSVVRSSRVVPQNKKET